MLLLQAKQTDVDTEVALNAARATSARPSSGKATTQQLGKVRPVRSSGSFWRYRKHLAAIPPHDIAQRFEIPLSMLSDDQLRQSTPSPRPFTRVLTGQNRSSHSIPSTDPCPRCGTCATNCRRSFQWPS